MSSRHSSKSLRTLHHAITFAVMIACSCSSPLGTSLLTENTAATEPSALGNGSDNTSTFALLITGDAYKHSGLFEEVTSAPFPSVGAPGSNVSVWVSRFGAAQYLRISPDKIGSNAIVPRGTVIVREVHDEATGAVTKLTLMAKGPPGYDPDLGDWFFLEASQTGIVEDGDGGAPLSGAMPGCHSCHVPRSSDDYLFGVSAANRADHP